MTIRRLLASVATALALTGTALVAPSAVLPATGTVTVAGVDVGATSADAAPRGGPWYDYLAGKWMWDNLAYPLADTLVIMVDTGTGIAYPVCAFAGARTYLGGPRARYSSHSHPGFCRTEPWRFVKRLAV